MGNKFSRYANLFEASELLDFSFGSISDRGRLTIEILFKSGEAGKIEVWLFETRAQIGHPVATGTRSIAIVAVAAREVVETTA